MDVKLKARLDRPLFSQTPRDSQGMPLKPSVSPLVSYPLSCSWELDLALLWTQARRPAVPLPGLCTGAVLGCAVLPQWLSLSVPRDCRSQASAFTRVCTEHQPCSGQQEHSGDQKGACPQGDKFPQETEDEKGTRRTHTSSQMETRAGGGCWGLTALQGVWRVETGGGRQACQGVCRQAGWGSAM